MTTTIARRPYTGTTLGSQYNRKEIRDQLNLLAQSISPQATRSVTAVTVVQTTDDTLLCDATTSGFAVTLPLAGQVQFLKVSIKKTDSSGHAVTITASGSDTIDGAATVSLASQYESRTIQSDGVAWWVLASI